MRLFELDDTSLHDKLVKLINDPNVDPNTKKIAQNKLAKLNSSEIVRLNNEPKPTQQAMPSSNLTHALTSFGSSKKIVDTNRPFMIKDQKVIMFNQFDSLLSKIKSTFIEFDDGTTDDPKPNIKITATSNQSIIPDIIQEYLKSAGIQASKVEKTANDVFKFYIL